MGCKLVPALSLGVACLVGLLVGSAIANFVCCWPASLRRWLTGRSHCDGCGRLLTVIDLLPVAGWLLRRARCQSCGMRISPFYPMVELAAAAIGGISMAVLGSMSGAIVALAGWMLLTMALIDHKQLILPDMLTLPLLLAGLAGALLPAWPGPTIDQAAFGAVAGFTSFWLVRAVYFRWRGIEGLGLGDAKLFAAAGTWCGASLLPTVVLIAGALGLTVALWRGQGLDSRQPLAFGSMLAFGFWVVLLSTWPI